MDKRRTRYEALIACRDAAGSDSQMGRDLGIPQSTMWRIINSSKQLPAEYVLQAEALYDVSRHDLRPDIYPRERMIDRMIGHRFEGVDRNTGPVPHGGRLCADRRAVSSGNSAEISLSRAS